MGKHSLDTPGHKRKDPATKGAAILNLVSGVLNVVTATAVSYTHLTLPTICSV